ncbi:MAG: FHA domain-containing protein [Gammaproteobacteria bacterium]|nr:FHA domain-containing protein [Gammaproteobacteria bacterium]
MSRLVVKQQGVELRSYELDKQRMTIGRRSDNDIQLDDPAVSGCHAVLTVLPNEFLEGSSDVSIIDFGSTNGIFVNKLRVRQKDLKDGDVIILGMHEMVYVTDDAEPDMERTAIIIEDDT